MRAKKTKRFSLVVKHTLERDIIIDFIIIDWLGVCPIFFFFQEKSVFHITLCIFMCDWYFGLVILVIILLVVDENC